MDDNTQEQTLDKIKINQLRAQLAVNTDKIRCLESKIKKLEEFIKIIKNMEL